MAMTQLAVVQILELNSKSREFWTAYKVMKDFIVADQFPEEPRSFRHRFIVKEKGPKTKEEKLIKPKGYDVFFLAAKVNGRIVGATYGSLIVVNNVGYGFYGYVSVLPKYRLKGIGKRLLLALEEMMNDASLIITGRPLAAVLFEIGAGNKSMLSLARSVGASPLDVTYYQPQIKGEPKRLLLFYQHYQPGVKKRPKRFPSRIIGQIVKGILEKEYYEGTIGNIRKFDLRTKTYRFFKRSIKSRKFIGLVLL